MHTTHSLVGANLPSRPFRFATTLILATALVACGGGGGGSSGLSLGLGLGGGATGSSTSPGNGNQTTVVVTPNDPATAGPPAAAVTPPGADTSASLTESAAQPALWRSTSASTCGRMFARCCFDSSVIRTFCKM